MKREDLEALRVPLTVLGVTLLGAILVMWFSGGFSTVPSARKHARIAAPRSARAHPDAGKKKRCRPLLGNYQQLARAGFVGDDSASTGSTAAAWPPRKRAFSASSTT